ncbi:MAG: matrixin family metalloprotease [Pyrinomonadaceae bacterium]|nr:matrixin family metalloprotease [Pyrinomonadaceae bacterium]
MLFLSRILVSVLFLAVTAPVVAASSTSINGENRGIALRWRSAKLKIAVSSSLATESTSIKPASDVDGAIARSFERWRQATGIEFEIVNSGRTNVSPSGPTGDGVSLITIAPSQANLSVFAAGAADVPATTRIFFSRQGYISEADIVLNPTQVFSTDGTFGTFDLEAVLVHEIGHLLGLEHAPISGAMMYRSQARNGHFASPAPNREISPADIAAARALYGSIDPDVECCFAVDVATGAGFAKGTSVVWAEEADTGRVVAAANPQPERTRTSLEGLTAGNYKIYVQNSINGATRSALVPVVIESGGRDRTVKTLPDAAASAAELEFIGTNGQLSKMPLTLDAGRTHTVLIAGKGIDAKSLTIGSTSPFVRVVTESARPLDYGEKIEAISVEVAVAADALPGSYTLIATDRSGAAIYFPAAINIPSR